MCGNAIRCVAKYLYDNGIVKKLHMDIETLSGTKELFLTTQNSLVSSVKVNMGNVKAEKITIDNVDATYVDVGNPHLVLFRDKIDNLDIANENYEKSNCFFDGINTEFVEIVGKNTLKMRVWERGSGETLACGTGACASAAAAVLNDFCNKNEDIKVTLLGGELIINYTGDAVFMTGECIKVFDGTVEI
jgi:carbamoyl-phosphate synthase large subunit